MNDIFSSIRDRVNEPKLAKVNVVLNAITDVISSKKKDNSLPTPLEYFCTTISSIESSEREYLPPLMYLLSIELDSINHTVIGSKFNMFIPIITNAYKQLIDFDQPADMKDYIKVLSKFLLYIESDMSLWSDNSAKQAFLTLILCSINKNPKLRKWSKDAIFSICQYNSKNNFMKPFEILLDFSAIIIKDITVQEKGEDLALLSLLTIVAPLMSFNIVKQMIDLILKILILHNEILSFLVFQVCNAVIDSSPNITDSFCKDLLLILINHQSNTKYHESNTINEYITLLSLIISHITSMELIYEYISPTIETIISYYQFSDQAIVLTINIVISAILQKSITTDTPPNIVQSIIDAVETVTTFQYQKSWQFSLKVLVPLIKVLRDRRDLIENLIISVASLRNAAIENEEPYANTINYVLSMAMQYLTPSVFLQIIPLRPSDSEIPGIPDDRLWILKLLMDNCNKCEGHLEFFIQQLIPIANYCEKSSVKSVQKELKLIYHNQYEEIWSIFPLICNNCKDISLFFPPIAPNLGKLMNTSDSELIIIYITKGLLNLIKSVRYSVNEKDISIIKHYANNYLPILFNLFEKFHGSWDDENVTIPTTGVSRNGNMEYIKVIGETIQNYLKICDYNYICSLYNQCLLNLVNASTASDNNNIQNTKTMVIMSGLLNYFIDSLESKEYLLLFNSLKPLFTIQSIPLQRRLYNILYAICKLKSEFLNDINNKKILCEMLIENINNLHATSKKMHLRCISMVIKSLTLSSDEMQNIPKLLPEILASLKDTNTKLRHEALELIIDIGNMMVEGEGKTLFIESEVQISLAEYIKLLSLPLMGTTNVMKSASIIALSRIIYQYKDRPVIQSLLTQIIQIILALFKIQVKEIIKSCLGFIKVLTSIYSKMQLERCSEQIIKALFVPHCKQKFRNKVKVILERLVRKIGYENVEPYIPEEDKKVIINIKKSLEKNNREKANTKSSKMEVDNDNDSDGDDGEDGDDDEIEDWLQHLSKDYKLSTLQEGGNEPLDLLGTGQVLTANQPMKRRRNPFDDIDDNIKYDEGGKLILGDNEFNDLGKDSDDDDDDDDDENDKKKKVVDKKRLVIKGSKQSQKIHQMRGVKDGEEYKAKKAKGDIVLKGKPEPYSYVKLDSRDISKKGRKFAIQKYKKVVIHNNNKEGKKNSRKKIKLN